MLTESFISKYVNILYGGVMNKLAKSQKMKIRNFLDDEEMERDLIQYLEE